MFTLFMLSIMISINFMFMSHPVSMSLMIFLQTLSTSLICKMITNMNWFSYMMLLVMIGGLLILFLYMINVASNEKFKPFSMTNFFLKMMLTLMITFSMMSCPTKNSLWNSNLYNNNMQMILMKFFNYPSNLIIIMMMIYLLTVMIMSVKITNVNEGALRSKF